MFSISRLASSVNTTRSLLQQQVACSATWGEQSIRWKHSSTQIKRLFKRNPARFRVAKREGWIPEPEPLSPPKFDAILVPNMLPNGWSAPPSPDIVIPKYPFQVSRTKNKPHDAVGFLPVYAEFRYVFFVLTRNKKQMFCLLLSFTDD